MKARRPGAFPRAMAVRLEDRRGTKAPAPGPFSRKIDIDTVPDSGLDIAIAADAEECAALAAQDALPAIADLKAEFHVAKTGRTRFAVTGTVWAKVTQNCVVSLDPFETALEAPIDVDFEELEREHRHPLAPHGDVLPYGPDRDPPDPIIGGRIDLGALAAEFLALALDPYPKKPGIAFPDIIEDVSPETRSPFSVLRKLGDAS